MRATKLRYTPIVDSIPERALLRENGRATGGGFSPRLKKFQQKPARSGPFLIARDHSRPKEITQTPLKTGTAQ